MKFALSLIVISLSVALGQHALQSGTCQLLNGADLYQFSGRKLNMDLPCKFNMVLQNCGSYQVTLTPGLKFVYPNYILDTVWLGVKNLATGQYYRGRTTNNKIAKYIIAVFNGEVRDSWTDRPTTDVTFASTFSVSSTSADVTIKALNGDFSVTVGPYDFTGLNNADSKLVFECHVPNTPAPFPQQYCGTADGGEIKDVTEAWFGAKTLLQYTIPFGVFNDTTIEQVDPLCIQATEVFTQQCANDLKRTYAIAMCEKILQSSGHTKCVATRACDPMEVFVNCLKYVCSDYTDKVACEHVGRGIDLCREFGEVKRWELMGLSDRVSQANCYTDLLTREDNPFYVNALNDD